MAKVILFARVSSVEQDYNRQISDLLPLIREDGYTDDDILYIHHKESAVKNDVQNRKSISELTSMIHEHDIKAVYVTEISRLARRGDVMYSVLALLEQNRIALVIQHPTLLRTYENGHSNPMAHVVISFLSQVAAAETELKLERQKSGYQQKMREGKVVSSKVKFGYRRENGYAVIDKRNAEIVNEIFQLYLEDNSVSTIYDRYKHLGIFGNVKNKSGWNKVTRLLRDTTYVGRNKHFKYPRIIDDEVFDAVQEKMDSSQLVKTNLTYVYYCQGLVKVIGHTMTPNASKAVYTYKDTDNGKTYSINANVVDSLAFNVSCEAVSQMMQSSTRERKEKAVREAEIASEKLSNIDIELKGLNARSERINDMYQMGKYTKDKYLFEIEKVEGEIDHILKEKEDLEQLKLKLEAICSDSGHGMDGVKDYYQLLDIRDDRERQRIVREAIKGISLEYTAKGQYKMTIAFNDPTLNDDAYYLYSQSGCKIRLYCCYGDMREDLTGTWENRIRNLQQRKGT